MSFSRGYRSRKILASISNIENDSSQSSENSKNVINVVHKTKAETGLRILSSGQSLMQGVSYETQTQVVLPEKRRRSNSSSSSSSSTSSSSSSSMSTSSSTPRLFIEDSDDSVKDPDYHSPSETTQQSQKEMYSLETTTPTTSLGNIIHSEVDETEIVPKKGRKRTKNIQNWKKNIVKRLRNTGKSYVTQKNKVIEERKMKGPCGEQCKFKCKDNVTEDERKVIFEEYWKLGEITKQWDYISRCMVPVEPIYRYIREGGTRNPRRHNNAFYFNLADRKVRVCKVFFKNTLSINDRPIRTVMDKNKQIAGTLMSGDRRGKHDKHRKVDEIIKNEIREHIRSIPTIESHYTRANTSKVFIDGSKSISNIHKDYVENCMVKNIPFGNYVLFYRIFTEEFNISFFQPKKDLCDVCVAYNNCNDEEKENGRESYEKHIREKDLCRAEKARDKENNDVKVAVYDLQAVFQCPKGDISVFYYKCKLNVLNFTIYNLKSNSVDCYVWDESNANRGVNEIGTCVFRYLENLNAVGEKDIDVVFYSDNCAGQQKNKMMIAIYLFAVQKFPNINSITHKYLIKGHTQNEGDSAHSLIERQVKKQLRSGPMYSPEAFISAIKTARKNPEPFHVHEMCTEDFRDWKDACTQMGVNITKDEHKNTVKITEVKVLKVEKTNPRVLFYKNSYEEEDFKKAEIIKRKKAIDINVKKAYENKPGISEKKKADLIDLLKKNLIPRFYAPFYNSL